MRRDRWETERYSQEPAHVAMRRHGFRIVDTAGGCAAYVKRHGSVDVVVTIAGDCLLPTKLDEAVTAGVYSRKFPQDGDDHENPEPDMQQYTVDFQSLREYLRGPTVPRERAFSSFGALAGMIR